MSEALFHPSRGYYRTKNPIGKNSDFITAPEISQVFGELLAAYLVQIASSKKTEIALVEMGAGKGTLFKDIINSIRGLAEKRIPQAVDFLERATFHIVEINPVLQKVQKESLGEFEVKWYETFSEFVLQNQSSEIFFVSNELFDCFPIDQFVKTAAGWRERMIGGGNEPQILKQVQDDGNSRFSPHLNPELVAGSNNSHFFLADFNQKSHDFIENEIGSPAPINAVFEYSLEARSFMAQLCQSLKQQGGIAIIIDYGYIKNEFANTFQAIKNHQKCHVLENFGEADLTALVDFLALEKIAQNCDLKSSLISQGQFLVGLGIEERRKALLTNKSAAQQKEINLAIDRLIDSNQMGELFKCLIIWS